MRGKHLMSPEGGENALPKPKDSNELAKDGMRHGKEICSPPSAKVGSNTNVGPTPDMMGTLFNHKRNPDGV